MDSIVLTLDRVIPPGNYTVDLQRGNDINTLLDLCDTEIPASDASFTVPPDVSAAFTYTVTKGCENDEVNFFHDGLNGAHTWNWQFDNGTATTRNATMLYNTGGSKNVQLTVSNDHCTDVATAIVPIDERINAAFAAPEIICSNEDAVFTNQSTGPVTQWHWDFGNGTSSDRQEPDRFRYPRNDNERSYRVGLIVTDENGCTDSAFANVIVVGNCNIVVPSAFSPNRDGKNDELYPSNAFNADNLIFRVYNRFGQMIFETRDWRRRWDGNVNGQPQNSGTYVWTLSYTLRSTGRRFNLKGTSVLVR
jgi:gliding motility-associated-like protein